MQDYQSVALSRRLSVLVVVGELTLGFASPADAKSPETVLYSFKGQLDGGGPGGGVLAEDAGNFFGITHAGGANGGGTVYELANSGGTWTETVLYNFCSLSKCADGDDPNTGVIPVADSAGNLYGTTNLGGNCSISSQGCGTVWELTPGGTWTETVLHNFAADTDGYYPLSGLTIDAAGNLYGAALGGGRGNCFWSEGGQSATGCGTVFKLVFNGKTWTYTNLYKFKGGSDGANPTATLIVDGKGDVYGATLAGGTGDCNLLETSGCGTVFKITPDGREKQLYAFKGGNDGANPADFGGGLLLDAGVIYGTTYDGGAMNAGTVFELAGDGSETPLYTFAGGNDGGNPWSGLIMDANGNLYSTTQNGGSGGSGVVFELASDGSETPRYDFCSQKNCKDGSGPLGQLLADKRFHHLYSTTPGGGAYGAGVVFSIDVTAASKTR